MIRAWLMMLWGRVWPYIAAVGAALGAVLAIRQSGKRAGRDQAERQRMESDNEGMRNAIKARDDAFQMDINAARDRAKRRVRDRTKR